MDYPSAHILPKEEDVACSLYLLDAISVQIMHPGAASVSGSRVESHHISTGDPILYHMSASTSNDAFLGYQHGQVRLLSAHDSAAGHHFPEVEKERGREAFLLTNPKDKISVAPPMHLRTALHSAFSGESHYSSVESPLLSYLVAGPSNATVLGHQSSQVLLPGEHASAAVQAELDLGHTMKKAIEHGLKMSLCPWVHLTIDGWATGPNLGYVFFIAHWLVYDDGILGRYQAVLAMCEVELSNMTETLFYKLKELKHEWFYPLRLEVGYVVTTSEAVVRATGRSCMGHVVFLVRWLRLLKKRAVLKGARKYSFMAKLFQNLRKIFTHFERSPEAHSHLRELQWKYHLPQELLKEEMPKVSSDIIPVMQFLLARQKAFSAYLKESLDLQLYPNDWMLMHRLVYLLQPFEETITTIRKENATLGQVLHELLLLESRIKRCFQVLQLETGDAAAAVAVHVAHELLWSPESIRDLGIVRENILYHCAAFLHPSFRDHVFRYQRGDVELGGEKLKERLMEQTTKQYLRNLPSDHATSPLYDERRDQLLYANATEVASQELESYLKDKIDPTQLDLDPLVYWNTKRHTWPSLSVVALQYFSCPLTSVHLEKVLSTEGWIRSGRYRETLALINLNRDWMAVDFRVSHTPAETRSRSMN
ncbi:zinc finger BED domain-containing protein 4-like [Hemicordylus capensis]|uniref:zinc finger BED domain-containing protein 4-like n=1 Tax=Hemicordylus capensis TaxID=884348 RepID=UPI002302B05F|nr:zinc finger BED domain-containing protein 4-like [Hemicordylus capensis]XP_053104149.1 zinc finger BED domain-containing protein 4-like [Hemicordylus capensis]XP_053104158.1 zinc finger BED domain-containing protein 4-like [Hemicordylus capensis]